MAITYPVRCKIVDVDGTDWAPGIQRKTPEKSRPHVGKFGTATRSDNGVIIHLDDGTQLYGSQCWWVPVD